MISEEHENNKGIYGTIRLKNAIQNKLDLVLNHKLIRRYKNILGLETVKRTKKGLSVSRAKEKNLINKAPYLIKESYKNLKPNKNAIVNTDQGAVYFAYEYVELANNMRFTRSMSHRGHCWENCPIENWFMQLKHEWLCQFDKLTRQEAAEEIKKYVHWYNNERIQKKLGYMSPVQYRLKYSN